MAGAAAGRGASLDGAAGSGPQPRLRLWGCPELSLRTAEGGAGRGEGRKPEAMGLRGRGRASSGSGTVFPVSEGGGGAAALWVTGLVSVPQGGLKSRGSSVRVAACASLVCVLHAQKPLREEKGDALCPPNQQPSSVRPF